MQTKFKDGSVMIAGFLARDAEFRQVGDKNTNVASFSVKVGERDTGGDKPEAIWVNCQCWHDLAKFASTLKKFDRVLAVGKLKRETYTQNGEEKESVRMECELILPQPKPDNVGTIAKKAAAANLDVTYGDQEDDGDLPF